MDKDKIIQWHLDNSLTDIVEEKTHNHLQANNTLEEKKPVAQQKSIEVKPQQKKEASIQEQVATKTDYNFNSIYQNLANKYKNEHMVCINNENINSVECSISKARELADSAKTIDELRVFVEGFDGHLDIKKLATNTVFGEGNQNADILILGEAPGNNEDIEGRPFCGQSGQLLNNMFKCIGMPRNELYITNTLFWRPPGNRTPTEEEVCICRPFVEKHIALVNPKIIVFMGSTAMKALVDTPLTITKARRQVFDYTNQYLDGKVIKCTPMFHPSYLLRQSTKKKDAWGDLLYVKDLIG